MKATRKQSAKLNQFEIVPDAVLQLSGDPTKHFQQISLSSRYTKIPYQLNIEYTLSKFFEK